MVVGAILENPQKEVLLIRQRKWGNVYSCFVGGHVHFGEKALDALRREVQEEVGLAVSDATFIGWDELIRPSDYSRAAHLIFLNFLCQVEHGDIHLQPGGEVDEATWMSPRHAEDLVLDSNRRILHALLEAGTLQSS